MNNDERKAWIKTLKEGDKVAVSQSRHYSVGVVKRVTPTGKVRLENDLLFDNTGWCRGDIWASRTLYPLNDGIIGQIMRGRLISKVRNLNVDSLTTEQLEKIAEVAGVEVEAI